MTEFRYSEESLKHRTGRRTCPRRVGLLFGGILCLALLFPPYRSTTVSFRRDPGSNIIYRTKRSDHGLIFVFKYFQKKRQAYDIPEKGSYSIRLQNRMLWTEAAIIIVLGAADFVLFCLLLAPKKDRNRL